MSETVRVERIRVKNVLAISELDVSPGSMTVVRGRNRRGKTSFIAALQALRGGGDETIIRDGADEAEVLVELSDGVEILKKIRRNGRPLLEVTHPKHGKISRPQTFLDGLFGSWSNPVEFLLAPPKRRGELLLETVPMTIDRDAVVAQYQAGGLGTQPASVDLDGRHPLQVLDFLREQLDRRAEGLRVTSAKDLDTAAHIRAAAAGTEDPKSLDAEITRTDDEINAASSVRDELVASFAATARVKVEELRTGRDAKIDVIRARYAEATAICDAKISSMKAALAVLENDRATLSSHEHGEILRADTETKSEVDAVMAVSEAAATRAKTDAERRIAELRGRRSVIETKLAEAQRARGSVEVAAKLEAGATESTRARNLAVEAIKQVDAMRADLLQHMPIPDLEVRDGEVYWRGHPFERCSQAEQVMLAVRLSLLNLGDQKFLCFDGAERLDAETFALMRAEIDSAGAQAIVTRVEECELTVEVKS